MNVKLGTAFRRPLWNDTVEKLDFFAAITIPEAAGGLQRRKRYGFGRKGDFSVCGGGRSELATATRMACTSALQDQIPIF